ncbi:MAG: hypothetical protein IPP72_20725 [Chitinophagaceae bacterium]|nr:hypothetical protein [Chitinophagaceae bacterium]
MRKFFTTLLCSLVLFAAKSQVGTTVVISQVYGGGGNSAAAFQNDYVELFNPLPVLYHSITGVYSMQVLPVLPGRWLS